MSTKNLVALTSTLTRADALNHIQTLSDDELDNIGYSGNTVLIDPIRWGRDLENGVMLGNAWKASYIGKKFHDSDGKLLLIPAHDWTRHVWCQGQVVFAMGKGMSQLHAERWVDSRVSQRHLYIDLLIEVMASTKKVESYLAYRSTFSPQDSMKWAARSGISDGLYHSQRVQFVTLLNDVVNETRTDRRTVYEPRPAVLGEETPASTRPWEL